MEKQTEERDTQVFVVPETPYMVRLPYSEVCVHMMKAGTVMRVMLVAGEYPMAQLYELNGTKFSFPILPGEAGILRDGTGRYYIQSASLVREENNG